MKINVNIYGDGSKHPVEAEIISCTIANNCSFYKDGKCMNCRGFLTSRCKYGSVQTIRGYTRRARRYSDFVWKYKNDEAYGKLKYPSENAAVMGNTLYMDLSPVYVRKNEDGKYEIENSLFFGRNTYIDLEDVTSDFLHRIFSYTARGFNNDIVESYARKRVPDIVQTLKRIAPDIYDNLITDYPEYNREPNYIGKYAYISSLKKGTEFEWHDAHWVYDGECVTSTNYDTGLLPWAFDGGKCAEIKIKVSDKMTIKVADNSICDDNTRFE